jgi:RNA polymerase sigma factor (sigma-70 family)
MNDQELLCAFVDTRSQAAFAGLVERHVDLVYSVALRILRDSHRAEDVAQQVFALLAQKAGRLRSRTVLAGWLGCAARNVAFETLRGETRRRRREQIAVSFMDQPSTEGLWERIEPLLDEAMGRLNCADHDALVLRFFENKSLKEVGALLRSNEDAAQKRVTRALDRLRQDLARQGVNISASSLAAGVGNSAVTSAPAGLAHSLAQLAFTVAATGTSPATSLFHLMTATKTQLAVVAVLLVIVAGALFVGLRENAGLRGEIAGLRERQNAAASEATAIAKAPPSPNPADSSRLRRDQLELLSLRGQVTQLMEDLRQARGQTGGTPPATGPAEGDSLLFSAALTNRVPLKSTLVVGGWARGGLRGYVLVTPALGASNSAPGPRQLTMDSQVVAAPESFWQSIGWGGWRSETRRSTLAGILTPEQRELLLTALKEIDGSEISNVSQAHGADGERLGIGFSMDDGSGAGVLMAIDIFPQTTADGQAVELGLLPSAISDSTAIHSSLK